MERKAVPETFHLLGKAQESKWIYLFLKGKHCSICHLPWIFHLSSQKHYKSISILTFIHLFICVFPSKPINNQPPKKVTRVLYKIILCYSLYKKRAHVLTRESVLRSDFSQTGCYHWIPNLTAPRWRFNHKHGALEISCRLIASIWEDIAQPGLRSWSIFLCRKVSPIQLLRDCHTENLDSYQVGRQLLKHQRVHENRVSSSYPQIPHLWIQETMNQTYFLKISESSPKQNLHYPLADNYLHSMYFIRYYK